MELCSSSPNMAGASQANELVWNSDPHSIFNCGKIYRSASTTLLERSKMKYQSFSGQNRLRAKVSAVSEDSTFARSPLTEVQTSTNNNSNSVAPRHIFRNSFRRTKNKHKLVQESDHSQGGEETGNDYLILNMYRRLFSRSHVYGSLGTPSK